MTMPQLTMIGWCKVKYNINPWKEKLENLMNDHLIDHQKLKLQMGKYQLHPQDDLIISLLYLIKTLDELSIHSIASLRMEYLKKLFNICNVMVTDFKNYNIPEIKEILEIYIKELMLQINTCYLHETAAIKVKQSSLFAKCCNPDHFIPESPVSRLAPEAKTPL